MGWRRRVTQIFVVVCVTILQDNTISDHEFRVSLRLEVLNIQRINQWFHLQQNREDTSLNQSIFHLRYETIKIVLFSGVLRQTCPWNFTSVHDTTYFKRRHHFLTFSVVWHRYLSTLSSKASISNSTDRLLLWHIQSENRLIKMCQTIAETCKYSENLNE